MFAVIRAGGKQYRVAKDDRIVVERLTGEPGTMIQLSDVLMLGGDGKAPAIGNPAVAKAAVFAEVLEHNRADKVIVFKKYRRNNYRRKNGHRQHQTLLRIVDVSATGTAPAFTPTPKKEPKVDTQGKTKAKKAKKAKAPAKEAAAEDAKSEAKAEAKPAPKKPAKATKEAAPKKKAAGKAKAAPKKKSGAKGKAKE
jgi:large subunit ribosomal protein L21